MVTSYVKTNGGVPALFINGEPINPMAYITYFTDKNMYREFSHLGYSLYSVPTYFASQTINEASRIPPFGKGIFDGIYLGEQPDYGIIDRLVAEILEACPTAYIFPRVNVSVPYEWEEQNPDECCAFSYTVHRRASFWSDAWLYETKRLLGLFVDHIERSPYRDNIIGYQISCGNTEEWFPFDMCGCRGVRADEKFEEYCLSHFGRKEGSESEYMTAFAERTAYCIIELAKAVKNRTDRRLAVGAFYGYSYEVTEPDRGHSALRTVLESDAVDFLCSPNSYYKVRIPGIDHPYMLPIDSVKLSGKLYLAENDTRTHLSAPPNDLPRYQSAIWRGPEREVTVEIIKMHFAKALCHGNGMWWFDMWGGWYRDEAYLSLLGKLREIYEAALGERLESSCEVAMLFDEKGTALMKNGDSLGRLIYNIREPLGLMGVPYDMYLADDFDKVSDKYKAFILVQPIKTELFDRCVRLATEREIPMKVINGDNADVSADELRNFCRDSGAHIYSNKKAVVYSNNSFVFLHTGEEGEIDFSIPGVDKYTDLFAGKEISFPTMLPLGKSFLFKK